MARHETARAVHLRERNAKILEMAAAGKVQSEIAAHFDMTIKAVQEVKKRAREGETAPVSTALGSTERGERARALSSAGLMHVSGWVTATDAAAFQRMVSQAAHTVENIVGAKK